MERGAGQLNAREAADAINSGLQRAHEMVFSWTDGSFWLRDIGSEGTIHAFVAQSLAEVGCGFVVPEWRVADAREAVSVGARPRGRIPQDMRLNGRCDIALFSNPGWDMYAAIEIKRAETVSGWREDLGRLCSLMSKYGKKEDPLDFCVLGLSLTGKSRNRFFRKLSDLDAEIAAFKTRYSDTLRIERWPRGDDESVIGCSVEDEDGNESWCWGPFSVVILRKGMHFSLAQD